MLRTPASRVSTSVAIIAVLVAWTHPASASSITWEFSAHIDNTASGAYAALANTVIFGSLSFDSNQPTPDPNHSLYSVSQFVFDLPAIHSTWTYQGGGMEVYSQSWRDPHYGVPCYEVGTPPSECLMLMAFKGTSSNPDGPPPLSFEIRFEGFKGFPTADLPLAPPPGVPAAIGFPNAYYCTPICGSIDDMHVTPEPTTLTLLGGGLVTVGWGRYRRRQRRSRS
jgi:hypothetical protein